MVHWNYTLYYIFYIVYCIQYTLADKNTFTENIHLLLLHHLFFHCSTTIL
jgi:hypothetical protein